MRKNLTVIARSEATRQPWQYRNPKDVGNLPHWEDCFVAFGSPQRRGMLVFTLACLLSLAACHRHEVIEGNAVAIVGPNTLVVSAPALAHLKLTKSEKVDFPEYLTLMGRISPTGGQNHRSAGTRCGRDRGCFRR